MNNYMEASNRPMNPNVNVVEPLWFEILCFNPKRYGLDIKTSDGVCFTTRAKFNFDKHAKDLNVEYPWELATDELKEDWLRYAGNITRDKEGYIHTWWFEFDDNYCTYIIKSSDGFEYIIKNDKEYTKFANDYYIEDENGEPVYLKYNWSDEPPPKYFVKAWKKWNNKNINNGEMMNIPTIENRHYENIKQIKTENEKCAMNKTNNQEELNNLKHINLQTVNKLLKEQIEGLKFQVKDLNMMLENRSLKCEHLKNENADLKEQISRKCNKGGVAGMYNVPELNKFKTAMKLSLKDASWMTSEDALNMIEFLGKFIENFKNARSTFADDYVAKFLIERRKGL